MGSHPYCRTIRLKQTVCEIEHLDNSSDKEFHNWVGEKEMGRKGTVYIILIWSYKMQRQLDSAVNFSDISALIH